MRVIFLPRTIGPKPRDHVDNVAVVLLASENRLILTQCGVDLLPNSRWVAFALRGKEIGQVAKRLANRRVCGKERALRPHNAKNLLGQLALAGVAGKLRLIAHDRCSSANTSSR